MQKAMELVSIVKATKRIPEDLSDWSFFSTRDVWMYESENTENRCINCEQFVHMTFFGDELRWMFPDLLIIDEMTILPRVHVTLWNRDTCKCRLKRTFMPTQPKLFENITWVQ